jgi:hypothetical protein
VKDLTNSMSCSVTPNSSSSCCCGSGCDWFGRFGFLVFVLALERPRRNHEDRSMGSAPMLLFRKFWMIRVGKFVVFRLIDGVPSSAWVVVVVNLLAEYSKDFG